MSSIAAFERAAAIMRSLRDKGGSLWLHDGGVAIAPPELVDEADLLALDAARAEVLVLLEHELQIDRIWWRARDDAALRGTDPWAGLSRSGEG